MSESRVAGAGPEEDKAESPGSKSDMPDQSEHDRREQDMVDLGSESSFPASDPPSYMGGTAVAGPPPHDDTHREPVSTELIDAGKADRARSEPGKKDAESAGS